MNVWGFLIGEIFLKISGTEWETTRFRRSSINSPYGQFDFVESVKDYKFYNVRGITDKSGEFEIFPDNDSKCVSRFR